MSIELEKPRDIILSVVEAMAAQLCEDGFSFRKAGPTLQRVDGDFTFEIRFQSSKYNRAGERVIVRMSAIIESAALKVWRRKFPPSWMIAGAPASGVFAGGYVGSLRPPHTWLEWDFVNPTKRESEIADAVSTIRTNAFPFFRQMKEPEKAIDALMSEPGSCQVSVLEYALVTFGQTAAEDAARKFLRANPAIASDFNQAMAKFRIEGPPNYRSSTANDMALLAITRKLDFESA